ncbi:hypothetical protein [Mycobacteroides salmoniphilum]|uniref:hypothetical protein n=1 Tax=Mycobacteroides salmoniphilum TaxID=404941 RepID=UPI0012FF7A13|nr:hypothetical protein [Mycobacteroides salmoniphilum]
MSNHVVVVLETTDDQPMSLTIANDTCEKLCGDYTEEYPRGLKVTARLGVSKAVFTITGYLGYVDKCLQSLCGKAVSGRPGTTFSVNQRVLTVKSCTIIPAPPKPPARGQSASVVTADDGYNQMMDLVFKMATLTMQGFDS